MFRAAKASDFEDIMRLYRQLHPDDPAMHDGSDAAAFDQILKAPALHLFVLEVNCSIVATTYLNVIPNITRSTSPYALIENVVVEESLRGTGLGKGNHVCHARGRMRGGVLQVDAYDELTQARDPYLYKACGFSADVKTAYVARPS